MLTSRRLLLGHAAGLAGAALLPSAWRQDAIAAERLAEFPFALGVASGDPAPDGVVLWTRLAPRPLDADGGMPARPVAVSWEVAEDEGFRRVAAKGRTRAVPEAGHSVHVETTGLQAGREYWYRFTALGHASPIGRTHTTPAPGASPGRLRIAYGSCQKYEAGFYGAYEHLVADAPDLVLFLGDYIYEQGATDRGVRRHPGPEPTDLAGYRVRYGAYKSDLMLQAAHAVAPWMVVWDDHEVENDYGGAHDRADSDQAWFLRRRAAAYQAYYEHMPLRRRSIPVGPDMLLHRTLDWGRLAQIQLLDTRQHRPQRTCDQLSDGKMIPDCPERWDPSRSLLGHSQEQWLMTALGRTRARWNILAQQYAMGELRRPGAEPKFSNDGWDGYPQTRERILRRWADAKVSNPLVLGGDIHTFLAGELKLGDRVVAGEFVGGSISSLGGEAAVRAAVMAANPHIRLMNPVHRGYGLVELTPQHAEVTFRAVRSALVPTSEAFDLARFVVEDGAPGLKAA